MTILFARRWLILASLIVSGLVFLFVILAPVLGYPLTWDQALRIVELIVPVFFGYLGTGTHFLFGAGDQPDRAVRVAGRHVLDSACRRGQRPPVHTIRWRARVRASAAANSVTSCPSSTSASHRCATTRSVPPYSGGGTAS